jgi:hypothetical protein
LDLEVQVHNSIFSTITAAGGGGGGYNAKVLVQMEVLVVEVEAEVLLQLQILNKVEQEIHPQFHLHKVIMVEMVIQDHNQLLVEKVVEEEVQEQ